MPPKAPASIMASRPTLTSPARSANVSPRAARNTGTARRTAAAYRAVEVRISSRSRTQPPPGPADAPQGVEEHIGVGRDQQQHGRGLDDLRDRGGDGGGGLGGVDAAAQRAEEQPGGQGPKGVAAADEGDRDRV